MANDALIDFQGDGASSDSILSYVHIQTAGYSGAYNDYVVPAAANFPLAGLSSLGAAVTPSRYIVRLNFTPFSNANLPILLKDVTSGGTSLTPVTGSPALNQYRWWYSANNNTVSPDVIEFNSGQAGHTIAIDCYAKQSILHSNQYNNPLFSGNIDVDGNITVNGTTNIGHLYCGNVTADGSINSSFGYKYKWRYLSSEYDIYMTQKIIYFGQWNMDTTASITVSHGISATDIISIEAGIRDDSGKFIVPDMGDLHIETSGLNDIVISRANGGYFDNTSFDSVLIERGYIIVHYKAI